MKKIFNIVVTLSSIYTFSQVGINTSNPLGKFHIDAKKNTSVSGGNIINAEDDVIITTEGKMGIGKIPAAKLEINSSDEATQSSLRFIQLNSESPVPPGPKARLGVNQNGDIVIVNTTKCVPSYLLSKGSLDTQVSDISLNTNISNELDDIKISGSSPNISISPQGYYVLEPGHTYRLESSVYLYGTATATGTFQQVRWYNWNTSTYFGSQPRSTLFTAAGIYADGEQGRAMAIITPIIRTSVSLVVTSSNGPAQYKPYYSYASILQINPCGVVD
ncbi:hypothetical protein ACM40_13605 [Chryseobacterium sp. BLS98]|uniref:hypothetical protein n=1 Tax=Chryseobacterium sp. BLS98 TaxID=885586 RepID=UPI00065AC61A|nr:hypothetical protein [Chryseobacterium sp. BLS98]KMQ60771.1 hypothetical protein ACM40_13605 [Chryseobacterium sp. BLS98]